MPFNINVTTDLGVYESALAGSRQRVIITPTTIAAPEAGGVAYVGSYNWSIESPCWVFETSGKACAEACAHEIGHTLSLGRHEGQNLPDGTHVEYYGGQGSGETGWAPIMGVGYYQNVSQWCLGQYLYADNPDDELAMIATLNNDVAYRPADSGDTLATSRYLELYPDYSAGVEGVIGRSAQKAAFQFTTFGGAIGLRVDPVAFGPDLALAADLFDATGSLVASNCPQGTLWAALSNDLPAGTYTLQVSGAGRNSPLTNGFSSYASLGYYSVTGFVSNARLPDRFAISEHCPVRTIVGTLSARNSSGDPLAYTIMSGNQGNTFALDDSGVLTVEDNGLLDYATLASQTQLTVQFELFIDINDLLNPSLTETNRRVVVGVLPVIEPPEISVTTAGSGGSGRRWRINGGGGSRRRRVGSVDLPVVFERVGDLRGDAIGI